MMDIEEVDCIRVLIVEDVLVVRQAIARIVQEIGYDIVGVAANGEEAVSLVGKLRPDVVIMDLEMPVMDGIEATYQIMETCPVPVVALTVHESPEWLSRASAAGVGAYLGKPATSREAERAITVARARFADMMELRRINGELATALAQVRTLAGLLPICASCKNVRDDSGYWQQIEVYIQDRSEAEFSHGLCPDCAHQLFNEIDQGRQR